MKRRFFLPPFVLLIALITACAPSRQSSGSSDSSLSRSSKQRGPEPQVSVGDEGRQGHPPASDATSRLPQNAQEEAGEKVVLDSWDPPKAGTYRYDLFFRKQAGGEDSGRGTLYAASPKEINGQKFQTILQNVGSTFRGSSYLRWVPVGVSLVYSSEDRESETCEYEPTLALFRFPFVVGDSWSSKAVCHGTSLTTIEHVTVLRTDKLVVGGETLTVVVTEMNREVTENGQTSISEAETWFSPRYRLIVKKTTRVGDKELEERLTSTEPR